MVNFEISGKVALVTGGASGLGLYYAKALLAKGAKGVTLADLDPKIGQQALGEIEKKFGANKAIFVECDVTYYNQFEDAFKETIKAFGNIDILINNAGIMNDSVWEKEVDINVKGVINGMLLGLDNYIPKHKSSPEGVILNVSSTAGVGKYGCLPVYVATKFAVHGLTLSWGLPSHYERTKVRVVGICPGPTDTPLIRDMAGRNLGDAYEKIRQEEVKVMKSQTPEEMVPDVMRVIEMAPSGTMWLMEGGEPAYQYEMVDREKMENKKYIGK
ncbi:15-hydroxyprostaglandin dehydrogenase [NAD(+)]-like [Anthonomus grandis grandis]|uniref:15-hydroxyprostaglandin dehydrogenase [NAD(+)]-like n=1 Tax=Anthonomus grandis grandis TaxID=2921223 RepID=UPI0021656624|nr:15-hydroxyprostaglandin dehydrogenase [NAD(+)]-like [Anthonomus grandis grandis]